jgi:hypothetical protein
MWIALIKREQGRFDACAHLIEQAQRGEIEIWTSAFTYAEVYKRNCSGTSAGIDAVDDNGKLNCQDGTPLRIKVPPNPPDPDAGTLFEGLKSEQPEKKTG